MSFASSFKPKLDRIRSRIPSSFGIRSISITVRVVTTEGSLLTTGYSTVVDTPIRSISGDRYKVKDVSPRDVVSSGGQYQTGAMRVGPTPPPFSGGGFTKADLIPPSGQGREVFYGVTFED